MDRLSTVDSRSLAVERPVALGSVGRPQCDLLGRRVRRLHRRRSLSARQPTARLSTAKGLSPGDTVDRLRQLYGPVPIRQETPQPGRIATKVFTVSDDRANDQLSGVLEGQDNKAVVTASFAGELC
jgi:hypothetical protein